MQPLWRMTQWFHDVLWNQTRRKDIRCSKGKTIGIVPKAYLSPKGTCMESSFPTRTLHAHSGWPLKGHKLHSKKTLRCSPISQPFRHLCSWIRGPEHVSGSASFELRCSSLGLVYPIKHGFPKSFGWSPYLQWNWISEPTTWFYECYHCLAGC